MKLEEFYEILNTAGYPVAYLNFPEEECPDMPFVVYQEMYTHNFVADNKTYTKIRHMQVDLYTILKDPEAEERLEAVFDAAEIPWESEADPDNDNRCHRVIYTVEV